MTALRAILVAGVLLTLVAGIWGGYRAAASKDERRRLSIEILCLAFIGLMGFGLLMYFPTERWAEGVATGFFAVCVYDIVRLIPGLVHERAS